MQVRWYRRGQPAKVNNRRHTIERVALAVCLGYLFSRIIPGVLGP